MNTAQNQTEVAPTKTKTHYYGKARQEIGRETNGGTLVSTCSDVELLRLHRAAWNRSDIHDLQVLSLEIDSREF